MREEEVSQMRQEIAKQTKMREAIQKKFHLMEEQKADVDVQRETLKAQIAGLEKGEESHSCIIGTHAYWLPSGSSAFPPRSAAQSYLN